ncbi:MAG: RimK family alpha-L-glutamate ligase [Nitrososphaerales archaeon]
MRVGILTRNPEAWCSTQLRKAFAKLGVEVDCFWFTDLVSRISFDPIVEKRGKVDLSRHLDALLVRPIGRGSLDEVLYRVDTLHRLSEAGLYIVNPPRAIERCVDKYYALSILNSTGIPVPKTVVTEDPEAALEAFVELGEDVILKPIFGSRGMGITRISDYEVARRIFNLLHYHHFVLYLQEYIPHGKSDIRAFVIGDKVVAAMCRKARSWKTNVSQGAKPVAITLSSEQTELALKAADTLGCSVAGVDILESKNGRYITEINSQPGFRGLQSVSQVNVAEEIAKYIINKVKM